VFARVTLHVSDLDASRRFYETVLAPLGHPLGDDFRLQHNDDHITSGLHLAFVSRSRAEVDAFWKAGIDARYDSDGEPGERPDYSESYYGGFLLDPDGNSAEAVFHGAEREPPGVIDHLWIRVSDLAAARAFWEDTAPRLGLTLYGERPERFHVRTPTRSFALVADGRPVTKTTDVAFWAGRDDAYVDPDGNRFEAVSRTPSGPP
jgi:catechol 2,3-dioxygenase-like lactoylglutathione lyase family enzyme